MNKLFFVALLCVAAGSARANPLESSNLVTSIKQSVCVAKVLNEVEFTIKDVLVLTKDAIETMQRLQTEKDTCEAIEVDESANWIVQKIQEAKYSTCLVVWNLTVLYEMDRLKGEAEPMLNAYNDTQECLA